MEEISLVSQLFNPEKAKILRDLYSDDLSDEARTSIKNHIAKSLSLSDEVIIGNELNQIILLMSLAPFANDGESVSVAVMTFFCIKQTDILPRITEHTELNLAARCLISLSLFKPALEKRRIRYGAPSPDYYAEVAKQTFVEHEMPDIATHFEDWNSFLKQKFNYS